jgi:hypothetical protein
MVRRLVSIALLLVPVDAVAQSTHQGSVALLGGLGLESGDDVYGPGVQIGARFVAHGRQSFDVRIEATYQAFGKAGTQSVQSCPLACPTTTGDRIKILSVNANAAWHAAGWPAAVLGVGLYGALETPHDGQYARLGWSLGLSSSTTRRGFFEMRYHGLPGRQVTRGFTTCTVGIRQKNSLKNKKPVHDRA